MPERLTAILSTPGVCVILRKHKCITSLRGQDEKLLQPSIVYASCQAPRQEGGLDGKEIHNQALGEEWLKNPGVLGLEKRAWWRGLHAGVFKNSRAVM